MSDTATSTAFPLMEMRPYPEWIGKTLGELNLRARYSINVVAIRSGEDVNAMPDMHTRIEEGNVMLVVSKEDAR